MLVVLQNRLGQHEPPLGGHFHALPIEFMRQRGHEPIGDSQGVDALTEVALVSAGELGIC